MPLNKSRGNMYPWCDFTWNVIKGKCPHDCVYCYMKKYRQLELHFDEKELKTDLGSGNTIFVGSSCDMWAKSILYEWIDQVLEHCRLYPQNKYLFQSKNPERIAHWLCDLPPKSLIGTTIETNRDYRLSKAPCPLDRTLVMVGIFVPFVPNIISIEPVCDFDLDVMVRWMKEIKPQFISIGADSQGHKLPEPSSEKVKALIEALKEFTEVKVKKNLSRLLGEI